MSYGTIFPKKHTLLPVIHVQNEEQALRNVHIAQENRADGCFLINHEISPQGLLSVYHCVRANFPNLWTGLNILQQTASDAMRLVPKDLQGLWTDNAGISDEGTGGARTNHQVQNLMGLKAIYFGGVAFKYQQAVRDPALVARWAMPFVDVVTTSGEGTGSAPAVEKIRAMKEAVGDHPLAIASGITPENVRLFMPHADCFLVATGISISDTELDPDKVRQLADILHA